jgi:hypothetical protein
MSTVLAGAIGAASHLQKFSEISGMLMMYFRFKVQRRIILMGSVSMSSIRFAITM